MTDKNPIGGDPFSIGILTPHLEGMPDNIQPLMKFGAKIQSEYMALCSHRARAWLDWPGTLSGCSTVQDLASAQTDFLSTMQRDYAAFVDGILRDTLIEQEELVEPAQPEAEKEAAAEKAQAQPKPAHREAA